MQLLFVDTETTGLDPEIHELIEIGAIKTDIYGNMIDTYEASFSIEKPEVANPAALKVNGRQLKDDPVIFRNDRELEASSFHAFSWGTTIVAKNILFDASFLRQFLQSQGLEPQWSHRMVDITGLAFPLYFVGAVKSLSSTDLCRFLGIQEEPHPHRAMNGAKQARELYLKILERLTAKAEG